MGRRRGGRTPFCGRPGASPVLGFSDLVGQRTRAEEGQPSRGLGEWKVLWGSYVHFGDSSTPSSLWTPIAPSGPRNISRGWEGSNLREWRRTVERLWVRVSSSGPKGLTVVGPTVSVGGTDVGVLCTDRSKDVEGSVLSGPRERPLGSRPRVGFG